MDWKIRHIKGNIVIAGTSTGSVMLFEGNYGTLVSNIKSHEADIKCLEYDVFHNLIYASGMDSKITIITNMNEDKLLAPNWKVAA